MPDPKNKSALQSKPVNLNNYRQSLSFAQGLLNRYPERYPKGTTPEDLIYMMQQINRAESPEGNVVQSGGGPGRGFYQIELDTAPTALNRYKIYQEELGKQGIKIPSITLPKGNDVRGLTLDQQTVLALANISGNAKSQQDLQGKKAFIDPSNPKDVWINYHWAGSEQQKPDRIAHWEKDVAPYFNTSTSKTETKPVATPVPVLKPIPRPQPEPSYWEEFMTGYNAPFGDAKTDYNFPTRFIEGTRELFGLTDYSSQQKPKKQEYGGEITAEGKKRRKYGPRPNYMNQNPSGMTTGPITQRSIGNTPGGGYMSFEDGGETSYDRGPLLQKDVDIYRMKYKPDPYQISRGAGHGIIGTPGLEVGYGKRFGNSYLNPYGEVAGGAFYNMGQTADNAGFAGASARVGIDPVFERRVTEYRGEPDFVIDEASQPFKRVRRKDYWSFNPNVTAGATYSHNLGIAGESRGELTPFISPSMKVAYNYPGQDGNKYLGVFGRGSYSPNYKPQYETGIEGGGDIDPIDTKFSVYAGVRPDFSEGSFKMAPTFGGTARYFFNGGEGPASKKSIYHKRSKRDDGGKTENIVQTDTNILALQNPKNTYSVFKGGPSISHSMMSKGYGRQFGNSVLNPYGEANLGFYNLGTKDAANNFGLGQAEAKLGISPKFIAETVDWKRGRSKSDYTYKTSDSETIPLKRYKHLGYWSVEPGISAGARYTSNLGIDHPVESEGSLFVQPSIKAAYNLPGGDDQNVNVYGTADYSTGYSPKYEAGIGYGGNIIDLNRGPVNVNFNAGVGLASDKVYPTAGVTLTKSFNNHRSPKRIPLSTYRAAKAEGGWTYPTNTAYPKYNNGGPVTWSIVEDRPMAQDGLLTGFPGMDTGVQVSDNTRTNVPQKAANIIQAKQFQSDLRNPKVTEEKFKAKHGISREEYRNRPTAFAVGMNQVWQGAKQPFKFIGADPDLIRRNPAVGIPQALSGTLMMELPVGEMFQAGKTGVTRLGNTFGNVFKGGEDVLTKRALKGVNQEAKHLYNWNNAVREHLVSLEKPSSKIPLYNIENGNLVKSNDFMTIDAGPSIGYVPGFQELDLGLNPFNRPTFNIGLDGLPKLEKLGTTADAVNRKYKINLLPKEATYVHEGKYFNDGPPLHDINTGVTDVPSFNRQLNDFRRAAIHGKISPELNAMNKGQLPVSKGLAKDLIGSQRYKEAPRFPGSEAREMMPVDPMDMFRRYYSPHKQGGWTGYPDHTMYSSGMERFDRIRNYTKYADGGNTNLNTSNWEQSSLDSLKVYLKGERDFKELLQTVGNKKIEKVKNPSNYHYQVTSDIFKTNLKPESIYEDGVSDVFWPRWKKPVGVQKKPEYTIIHNAEPMGPQNYEAPKQVDYIWTPYGKMSREQYTKQFPGAAKKDLTEKKAKGGKVTWQIID